MNIVMLIVGLLTVLSACGVVFSHRTFNSALYLVTTFFLVAVHFALLGADFLAALQIMVYAGAIMVLVIFVIMLLGLREPATSDRLQLRHYVSVVFLGLFVAVLAYVSTNPIVRPPAPAILASSTGPGEVIGTPASVGLALYTKYLFTLEVTSVLLLAAVIGAVLLAHDPKRPLMQGRGLRAKRTSLVEEGTNGGDAPTASAMAGRAANAK